MGLWGGPLCRDVSFWEICRKWLIFLSRNGTIQVDISFRICAGCTFILMIAGRVVMEFRNGSTDYSDRPLEEQRIQSMTVDTFGTEYPAPEKC